MILAGVASKFQARRPPLSLGEQVELLPARGEILERLLPYFG